MPETDIDIKYVADLARLELSAEQAETLQQELGNVVKYIAELTALDVDGVEPTAHASQLSNVWRQDVKQDSFPQADMLANAPGVVDGNLIKVPQVLPREGSN